MFDWLRSLSRFSMLINSTMWSCNIFFCIQLFSTFFHSSEFSESKCFLVQVFLTPGFSGSGSRVSVHVLEVAFTLITISLLHSVSFWQNRKKRQIFKKIDRIYPTVKFLSYCCMKNIWSIICPHKFYSWAKKNLGATAKIKQIPHWLTNALLQI